MIWGLLALIGGGTFVVNGFGVLMDPNCDTVSFGGGRVVQVTCYQDGALGAGALPSAVAGIGMVMFGALLIFFAWRQFKRSL